MLAVEGEVGHLLVVVHRIDEVGGVPGGAAGVGQGAFVELDDVSPPERGEVFDHRVTDDSGADHYHLGAGWEIAHPWLLLLPLFHIVEPSYDTEQLNRRSGRMSPPGRAGQPP